MTSPRGMFIITSQRTMFMSVRHKEARLSWHHESVRLSWRHEDADNGDTLSSKREGELHGRNEAEGVYRAIVRPSLLYACETWTVYQRHARKLNHFPGHNLLHETQHQVAGPDPRHWGPWPSMPVQHLHHPDEVPTTMGRPCCSHARPRAAQKTVVSYGELQQGKRCHGGQKKRFWASLKASLGAFGINPDTWEQAAQDRANWRSSVHKGSKIKRLQVQAFPLEGIPASATAWGSHLGKS